ncbi:MAG: hypothetical protein AAF694_09255 [Bacteroidota bacterium]
MLPIYILAVIFTGVIGITYVDGIMKLKKEQLKAQKKGNNAELSQQVQKLARRNADLQRRIENLEAIIVDGDLRLETGLDSRIEALRKEKSSSNPNELEF